jgi:hypothetical protein
VPRAIGAASATSSASASAARARPLSGVTTPSAPAAGLVIVPSGRRGAPLICRAASFGNTLTLPDDDEDDGYDGAGGNSSSSSSRRGRRNSSGSGSGNGSNSSGGGLMALLSTTLASPGGLFTPAPPRQRWFQQQQQTQRQQGASPTTSDRSTTADSDAAATTAPPPRVPLSSDELRQLLESGAASLTPLPDARALLSDDAARQALPSAGREALAAAQQSSAGAVPSAVLCISPALLLPGNNALAAGSSVLPVYALLTLAPDGGAASYERSSSFSPPPQASLVQLDVASGAALAAVASALTTAAAAATATAASGSTVASELLSAFLGSGSTWTTAAPPDRPAQVITTSSAAAWVRVGRNAAPDALERRDRAARAEAAGMTRAIVACRDVPSVQALVEANWQALDAIHVGATYVQLARLSRAAEAVGGALADDNDPASTAATTYDGVFLASLAQLAEHHLPQMQPRQVSSVLWATAALGRGPPAGKATAAGQLGEAWVRRMADGARRLFFARGMGPQAFANTLWALATLRVHPGDDWLDAFFEASLPLLGKFDARELANTLWALAALRRRGGGRSSSGPSLSRARSPLFRAWIGAALRAFSARMAAAGPQAMSNALWALASLGVRPPRLWMSAFRYYSGGFGVEAPRDEADGGRRSASAYSSSSSSHYTPQGLANMLWAHAVLSPAGAPARGPQGGGAEEAEEEDAAAAGVQDAREARAWLARMEASLLAAPPGTLQRFAPQALACALWGLVAGGAQPSSRFLQAWSAAATACAAYMSPSAAASVLWALSRPACRCGGVGETVEEEQQQEQGQAKELVATIDGALCAGLLRALRPKASSSFQSSPTGVYALPARVVAQLADAAAAMRVRDGPGRSRPLADAMPPETAAALAEASLAVLPMLGARTLARTGLAMAAISRNVAGGGPLLGLGWVRGFLAAAARRTGSRFGEGLEEEAGERAPLSSSSSAPPDAQCCAELVRACAAVLREAQRANNGEPMPLPRGWLSALIAASCAALAEQEVQPSVLAEAAGGGGATPATTTTTAAAAATILEAIADMPASGAQEFHLAALRAHAGQAAAGSTDPRQRRRRRQQRRDRSSSSESREPRRAAAASVEE